MKEKIEELIQHHTLACEELLGLINELHSLKEKVEDEEIVALVERFSSERAFRKIFIDQLKDLL